MHIRHVERWDVGTSVVHVLADGAGVYGRVYTGPVYTGPVYTGPVYSSCSAWLILARPVSPWPVLLLPGPSSSSFSCRFLLFLLFCRFLLFCFLTSLVLGLCGIGNRKALWHGKARKRVYTSVNEVRNGVKQSQKYPRLTLRDA